MSSSKELQDPPILEAKSGELDPPQCQELKPFRISRQERLVLLGSLLALLIGGTVLGLLYANARTNELFVKVPAAFFGVGKFLPLWPLLHNSLFSPYELGAVIWIMDTTTGVLFVYSFELLYKIGIVARCLTKIQKNARLVLRAYPSIRKFTIIGIVLFVLFPFSGTGAIGAAFLGALLGMHRVTLILTISVGGFLGGMGMAYAAVNAQDFARQLEENKENPLILVLIIAGVALAIFGMVRAYRKAIAKAEREEAADQKGSD